jgi:hypothetical protein
MPWARTDNPPAQQEPADSLNLVLLIILEGIAAGVIGAPITDNPYCPTTENGIRWRAGWLEARHALRETTSGPPSIFGILQPQAFSTGATVRLTRANERAVPF